MYEPSNYDALPPDYQELLAGYVLGDLTSDELTQVQGWMQRYPELEADIRNLQEALGIIPLALELGPPPPGLKAKVLATADREMVQESPAGDRPPVFKGFSALKRGVKWGRLITGLAVTGTITLGGQNLQLRQQLAQIAQTQPYKIVIATGDAVSEETWHSFGEVMLDHQDSLTRSQGPVDFASQDMAQVHRQYRDQVDMFHQFPELQRAKLLGGSFCTLSKTQGVRLSYQMSAGETISFYQLAQNELSLDTGEAPIPIQMFDGPNGLVWGDRDYVYVLVGDVPMGTIRQLWRSLRPV